MDNLTWLRLIHDIEPQDWHESLVIRAHDIDNYRFYDRGKTYRAVINPQQIKGIEYAYGYNCFSDITWIELLNGLKRFDYVRKKFTTHEALLEHIHYNYNEHKTVMKFGDIYITTTGQHRLAIAKFLEVQAIEVNVIDHDFNFSKYHKYQKRNEQYKSLEENGFFLKELEENAEDLERMLFRQIQIANSSLSLNMDVADSFLERYSKLSTNGLLDKIKIYFTDNGKTNHYRSIDSVSDIDTYENLMRLHKKLNEIKINSVEKFNALLHH